jgi:3-hydroxybutyryl-CoA dehydrogenase
MHFFNPAALMPLVEVVSGLATDPAVAKCLEKPLPKHGARLRFVCLQRPVSS